MREGKSKRSITLCLFGVGVVKKKNQYKCNII